MSGEGEFAMWLAIGAGRRDAMGRLVAWLGASPAEVESLVGTIEPAVDPDLVHYDSDLTAETKALQSFPWVRAVYAAAIGLCANPAADVAAAADSVIDVGVEGKRTAGAGTLFVKCESSASRIEAEAP